MIGSGETHTVRELVEIAFGHLGLDWQQYVTTDPKFLRPAEVDVLLADPGLARRDLGWSPTVDFRRLVTMMVDADLALLGAGK